ncbi:cytochrome b/b6 domain-containing protein [Chitinivorax sp. PXF-14]|uniref:cytochrome b/b6 domain-containing protein n=1 Tax=Chitinivorax sp. PXF-14 TaxID=3230488 RepID=UPI00346526FF
MQHVKVWDPLVRLFHWSLATCFLLNMAFTEEGKYTHRMVGYVALGLVAFRVLWGFIGSRHARFADFVPAPARLLDYLRSLKRGKAPRYLGHNPAAAMMILALMGGMLLLGFTGWLATTDAFFGEDWLTDLHGLIADGMLGMIVIHVSAAIIESLRHRENLIISMVTGRKRAEEVE